MPTTSPHIDHTPGGSPEGKVAAAPVHPSVNVRNELLGLTVWDRPMADTADVVRMARAAAAMGMRNADRYGADDRSDAVSDVVARIWAKNANRTSRCRRCNIGAVRYRVTLDSGMPGVTATVPLCERCATGHLDRRAVLSQVDAVPADTATFTHCLHLVANYRRSLDAQRERDAVDAAARALEDFHTDGELEAVADVRPDLAGTPMGAYWTAAAMLRAAGLADEPTAGPLWTLAYSSARAAAPDRETGETVAPEIIAAELDLTRATVRQHCKRAADRLSAQGFSYSAWLDALDVRTASEYARKGSAASLPATANGETVATDWRTRPTTRVANVADSAREIGRTTEHESAWLASTTRSAPADWSAYLSPVQCARLQRAADIRDSAKRARTETERAAIRRASGLEA